MSYLITGSAWRKQAALELGTGLARSRPVFRRAPSCVLLTSPSDWFGEFIRNTRRAAVACRRSLRLSVVGLLIIDSGGLIGRPREDGDNDNAGRATGSQGQWAHVVSVAIPRRGGNCACRQLMPSTGECGSNLLRCCLKDAVLIDCYEFHIASSLITNLTCIKPKHGVRGNKKLSCRREAARMCLSLKPGNVA